MSPVEILDGVGEVAYRLALHPPSKIHNVLHVSMFKKYVADLVMVEFEPLKLHKDITYKYTIRIVYRKRQVLRCSTIPCIKIQ